KFFSFLFGGSEDDRTNWSARRVR
ncbi:GNAT family N-acetyltransferase, partial [Pseudomonas aeruginosa]|nr:GNAT family N-acetyltransferase [Pseudomonas aeruginosa]